MGLESVDGWFFFCFFFLLGALQKINGGQFKEPYRVGVFGWVATMNCILKLHNLQWHKMIIVNGCPVCLEDVESADHLFVSCKGSRALWLARRFNYSGVSPNSLQDLFLDWEGEGSARGRLMQKTSFLAMLSVT